MGNNNLCGEYQEKLSKNKDCFSKGTVAKEKNKTFVIQRISDKTEEIVKIQVDGCLISDSKTLKCDFAFIQCKTGDIYFVELKGQDVNHAVDQIQSTIDHFKSKISSLSKKNIFGFIVSSGTTTKANISFSKKKKAFLAKYGVKLRREGPKLIERV